MAVKMLTMSSREEWLAKRTSYIGGSDAACIVGLNPWKSNVQLWDEKTGRSRPDDISGKSFVKYGNEAEEHLRALFALDYPRYKVEYQPHNLWLNDEYPWAHSSLDGWLVDKETGRRGVLEIKTTNILHSMQKEKWDHRIPDGYFCQVLHYLAVTGFDFAILKAQLRYDYDGEIFLNTKHYEIERAEVEADIEYLMDAERRFADCIKADRQPALLLPNI